MSACASKWIMTTLPMPWCSATRSPRPGDRVVAPDHVGVMPPGDLGDAVVHGLLRQFPIPVAGDGVAVVDNLEVVEHLDAEIEVVGARVVGVGRMARGPKRRRPFVVLSSDGAPTIATSGRHWSSCSGSVSSGRIPKVAGRRTTGPRVGHATPGKVTQGLALWCHPHTVLRRECTSTTAARMSDIRRVMSFATVSSSPTLAIA